MFAKKVTEDGKGWFTEIFGGRIPVQQMLLAWRTYQRVRDEIQAVEGETDNPLHKAEFVRYSVLTRTWMVSQILQGHFGLDFATDVLPVGTSMALVSALEDPERDWFPAVYEPVDEAVFNAMDTLVLAYDTVEPRNFFRQCHQQVMGSGRVPDAVFRERLAITSGRTAAAAAIAEKLGNAMV
jgi:hypothetical protein